jgi:hypothetical protein
MLKMSDVIDSPLFVKINQIYGMDLETKRRLHKELDNAANILIKNNHCVDYDIDSFSMLEKRIENCKFDLYVATKDILIGKEFDLD